MKLFIVIDYGDFYGAYSTLEKALEKAQKEYPYARNIMEYIVECTLDEDWEKPA